MHGPDLTPDVLTGLAWFYLLITLLNLGAAAHWVYWSRGQKLLPFEQVLAAIFLAGYGLLALGWLFGLPSIALYVIATLANIIALVITTPASIYQKVRAGAVWCGCAAVFQILGVLYAFGGPYVAVREVGPNRDDVVRIVQRAMPHETAESVADLVSKAPFKLRHVGRTDEANELAHELLAAGATASAHCGAPIMPLAVRDSIDGLAGPVTFFFGSVVVFWAFL